MKLTWKKIRNSSLIMLVVGVVIMILGMLLGGWPGFSFVRSERSSGFSLVTHNSPKKGEVLKKTKIDSIQNISVDVGGLDVYIVESDDYYIEYNTSAEKIQYSNKDGVLSVKGGLENTTSFSFLSFDFTESNYIRIYIPRDIKMQKVEIKNVVGNVRVSDVLSDAISLEVDASDVMVKNVTADIVGVEQSAGGFTGKNIRTEKLTVSTDAGDIEIKNLDAAAAVITSNIGAVNVQLDGKEEDYSFKLEAGFGDVILNHREMGRQYHSGNGKKQIKATSEMSDVEMRTK